MGSLQEAGYVDSLFTMVSRILARDDSGKDLALALMTTNSSEAIKKSIKNLIGSEPHDSVFENVPPSLTICKVKADGEYRQPTGYTVTLKKNQLAYWLSSPTTTYKHLFRLLSELNHVPQGYNILNLVFESILFQTQGESADKATILTIDNDFVWLPLDELEKVTLQEWQNILSQLLNDFEIGKTSQAALRKHLLLASLSCSECFIKTLSLIKSSINSMRTTRAQDCKKRVEDFAYFVLAEPILELEMEKTKKEFTGALYQILEEKNVALNWDHVISDRKLIMQVGLYYSGFKTWTPFESQKSMAFELWSQSRRTRIFFVEDKIIDIPKTSPSEARDFLAKVFQKRKLGKLWLPLVFFSIGKTVVTASFLVNVFFDSLEEWSTNPKILHSGNCLMVACIIAKDAPSELTADNIQKLCNFFILSINSLLLMGPLKVYLSCFKNKLSTEQQSAIEQLLEERREAELAFKCYFNIFNEATPTITRKLEENAKKFPYSLFAVFVISFIKKTTAFSIDPLIRMIRFFRNFLHVLPFVRKVFFSQPTCREMLRDEILVTCTQIPVVEVKDLFEKSWPEIYAADIIGKPILGHYDKNLLVEIRPIAEEGQAKVVLVEAPNIPTPVVAKFINSGNNGYQVTSLELDTLMRMQVHPHVVQIYGFIVQFGDHNGILMEHCEGGSLQNAIDQRQDINEKLVLWWSLQAASGLSYLHQYKVTHRDVKPLNMLLNLAGDHLKISDLGVVKRSHTPWKDDSPVISEGLKFVSQLSTWPETYICGTPGYIAPEIIDNDVYTSLIDVYSMGRSIWQMVYKIQPNDELVRSTWFAPTSINNLKPLFEISNELKDFAKKMMDHDANERGTMDDAYDFFDKLYKKIET